MTSSDEGEYSPYDKGKTSYMSGSSSYQSSEGQYNESGQDSYYSEPPSDYHLYKGRGNTAYFELPSSNFYYKFRIQILQHALVDDENITSSFLNELNLYGIQLDNTEIHCLKSDHIFTFDCNTTCTEYPLLNEIPCTDMNQLINDETIDIEADYAISIDTTATYISMCNTSEFESGLIPLEDSEHDFNYSTGFCLADYGTIDVPKSIVFLYEIPTYATQFHFAAKIENGLPEQYKIYGAYENFYFDAFNENKICNECNWYEIGEYSINYQDYTFNNQENYYYYDSNIIVPNWYTRYKVVITKQYNNSGFQLVETYFKGYLYNTTQVDCTNDAYWSGYEDNFDSYEDTLSYSSWWEKKYETKYLVCGNNTTSFYDNLDLNYILPEIDCPNLLQTVNNLDQDAYLCIKADILINDIQYSYQINLINSTNTNHNTYSNCYLTGNYTNQYRY